MTTTDASSLSAAQAMSVLIEQNHAVLKGVVVFGKALETATVDREAADALEGTLDDVMQGIRESLDRLRALQSGIGTSSD